MLFFTEDQKWHIGDQGRLVGRLVASSTGLTRETRTFSYQETEYESPDGMRTCGGGWVSYQAPALVFTPWDMRGRGDAGNDWEIYYEIYPGGELDVPDLEQAARALVGPMVARFRGSLREVSEVAAAPVSGPPIPIGHTAPDDRDRAAGLLTELEAVDAAADVFMGEQPGFRRVYEEMLVAERAEALAQVEQLCEIAQGVKDAPWLDCLFESKALHVHDDPAVQLPYWVGSVAKLSAEAAERKTRDIKAELEGLVPRWQKFLPAIAVAKALHARREAGEILINMGSGVRRTGKTGHGDIWAIEPNGNQPEPDVVEFLPHSKVVSLKRWRVLERQVLVLGWSGGTDVTIVNLPPDGPTAAQLEAVRKIETEDLKVEAGFFGLDPEVKGLQEVIEEAVAAALPRSCCPSCGEVVETAGRYADLIRPDGIEHDCADPARFLDQPGVMPGYCCGRQAHVVRSYATAFGTVQLLVYHKYGRWNMNIRVVLPPEGGEQTPEAPTLAAPANPEVADDPNRPVDLSALTFGGRAKQSPKRRRRRSSLLRGGA